LADAEGEAVDDGDLTAFRKTLPTQEFLVHEQAIEENLYMSFTLFYFHFHRHNRLNALAQALAAKRLPLHTATEDAVDLPKMVQVVCRFQADELLDRLPSAYLVDPIALHPPMRLNPTSCDFSNQAMARASESCVCQHVCASAI
jgi:hypothetical protein